MSSSSADGVTPRPVVIDGRMMFQPQCFGIARVLVEMVRRFPADSPVPVVLVLPSDAPTQFSLDRLPASVRIEHCDSPVTSLHRVRGMASLLRRLDAGVVFTPYHALAPLWVPCPLVVALQDCILESDVRLTNGRARQLAYVANTVRVLRSASAVVVPSDATAAVLRGFYSSVPPLTVIRYGVDAEAFGGVEPSEVERARSELDLPARFVLHVGSRRPHKNHEVLLRALARMDESVSLVLVGRADPRADDPVDRLVAELDLAHRVRLIDAIPDDLLQGTYRAAEVFAFPSVAEGFGLPPLEAMAAGVPVVASAIPVVAEVCADAALLVSPHDVAGWADALTRVLESAELREQMVQRGAKAVAEADWQTGATELFELLTRTARG